MGERCGSLGRLDEILTQDLDGNVTELLFADLGVFVKAGEFFDDDVQIWMGASAKQLLGAALWIRSDGAIQAGLAGGIQEDGGKGDGGGELSYALGSVKDPGMVHALRAHGVTQEADGPILADDGFERNRDGNGDGSGALFIGAIDDAGGLGLGLAGGSRGC